ncbi:sulfotransferase-like domain-containing protein [Marinitenerispora sediminis]|uniref:Sulfotransferase family protein n=1 Tax=Marinitenerispora sediminis TaxID=1931232 RepID=A0A368T960_9ACTN|nr:hypothetical protein [Marinitenerispora sediminis]RCV49010.1 hypothetical protein DEF28_21995 [Marinitenerispora sediminis]RCV51734.1 hypothetical protein DEF23_19940 [Marinitenerispora sediminis]RCV60958.1 hypothetical protein DEF24_05415 [Marinitenerispora sediminis]
MSATSASGSAGARRRGAANAPAAGPLSRFDPVLLVLSPPRCASTVLARALWNHTLFRWYLHEPYDRGYHHGADGPDPLRAALAGRLDRQRLAHDVSGHANGLVVKEMTFQAGAHLEQLVSAATLPVVFTLREPRLAVRSRMRQRARGGAAPGFPAREAGWDDLRRAWRHVRAAGIDHVIVDMTRLSRDPASLVPLLCARLGIDFSERLLSWPAITGAPLGRLGDEQAHWYERVLASRGFEPLGGDGASGAGAGPPADPDLEDRLREWTALHHEMLAAPEALVR